jgi:hypothetical protein
VSPEIPAKPEQIRAFLRAGGLDDMACRLLGLRKVRPIHIRKVFNVRPEEVLEWVAAHGLPDDCAIWRDDGGQDGIHLHRKKLRWHVWTQERGVRDQPDIYWRRRDAELSAVQILISFRPELFEPGT